MAAAVMTVAKATVVMEAMEAIAVEAAAGHSSGSNFQ